MNKTTLLNVDCMDYMAEQPDNYFDLACVDPPYGIGQDWKKRNKVKSGRFIESTYENDQIPTLKYFSELKRISVDQIIWGWNYFTKNLGPTNYLICWDKMSASNGVFKYSQFELASTSKKVPAQIVKIPWDGYRRGIETGIKKIHPHQKPVKLYDWLLKNYAKPGQRIIDTHLGSGSSAIAAHYFGCDFVGMEIDKDYFEAARKRFNKETRQMAVTFQRKEYVNV